MGYVYMMESIRDYDTAYKIGYSKNPNKRLENIQTGNDGFVKLVYTYNSPNARKIEKAIHRFYGHRNKNMEWFDLDMKDVVDFIPLCEKLDKNFEFLKNHNF